MTLLRLTPAAASHRGMRRRHNEDAIGYEYPAELAKLETYGALFIVADGVGGLAAGDKASTMTVEQLSQRYYAGAANVSTEERLVTAIQEVNLNVFQTLNRKGATTLVAIVITGDQLVAASVGDSQIFRIQGESITQLNTEDVLHSDDAEDGALTKAVGYREDLELETVSGTIQADDRILLCSDGLTRYLDTSQLVRHANLRDPRDSVRRMINQANAEGGADNISAIVVQVGAAASPSEIAQHIQRLSIRVAVDTEPMMKADVPSKPTTQIPLSRPETVFPEEILSKVEAPHRTESKPPMPRASESSPTPPAANNNLLIIGAVVVLVLGALVLGISLPLLTNQGNAATATSPNQDASAIVTEEILATEEASPAATEETEVGLQVGDVLRLERDVITYARVGDSTVAAFVAQPNIPYLIDNIFTDSEGILWYRFLEENSAQSGWVSANDLPAYRLQQN